MPDMTMGRGVGSQHLLRTCVVFGVFLRPSFFQQLAHRPWCLEGSFGPDMDLLSRAEDMRIALAFDDCFVPPSLLKDKGNC